ncbi:unnamed protein product [Urochloa humidicola]
MVATPAAAPPAAGRDAHRQRKAASLLASSRREEGLTNPPLHATMPARELDLAALLPSLSMTPAAAAAVQSNSRRVASGSTSPAAGVQRSRPPKRTLPPGSSTGRRGSRRSVERTHGKRRCHDLLHLRTSSAGPRWPGSRSSTRDGALASSSRSSTRALPEILRPRAGS